MDINPLNLIKKAAPLASIAAPFLPGPWGPAVGAGLSFLNAGEQQGKADALGGQMQGIANYLMQQYMANNPGIMKGLLAGSGVTQDRRTDTQKQNAEAYEGIIKNLNSGSKTEQKLARMMMKQMGITDADVKAYQENSQPGVDLNYNPYQNVIDDQFSPNAVKGRADAYFTPDSLYGSFANYESLTRSPYDAAVRNVEADAARRGVTNSSFTSSAIGDVRANQARDNSLFRNEQFTNLGNRKLDYTLGQESIGQELMTRGIDEARRRLEGMNNTLTAGVERGIGILGGLQGQYASNANSMMKAAGDMVQTIGANNKKKTTTPKQQAPFIIGQPKMTPVPDTLPMPGSSGILPGEASTQLPNGPWNSWLKQPMFSWMK